MSGRSAMLDLARRTVSTVGARDFENELGAVVDDMVDAANGIEFVFDAEENNRLGKADQSYDGELRLVNKSPTELRRMLASERDPAERQAIETAMEAWSAMGGYGFGIEAGYVDRGEPREAIVAGSLLEVASGAERVAWPSVRGRLSVDAPVAAEPDIDYDMFDYDMLREWASAEPLPDDGWY